MDVAMSSSGEWIQYHQQTMAGHGMHTGELSDSNVAVTSPISDCIMSPNSTTSGQLTPKELKPIRRRSRASKKTPTTLLNADTSNFRELVQQFTGCPRTPFAQKGPVNLNFELGGNQNSSNTVSVMAPPQYNYQKISHQLPQQQQQQQQQQENQERYQEMQQWQQEQQCVFSSNNANMQIQDGVFMDNLSLHEIAMDSYSYQNNSDGYFM